MAEPTLPFNIDAEQCVLGAILLSPSDCLPKIRRMLAPQHFYRLTHGVIFQAMCDCWDKRNGAVDHILLADELERRGRLSECGDRPYLTELVAHVPSWVYGPHYAQVVKEHAIRRTQIQAAAKAAKDAYDGKAPRRRASVEV